MLVFGFEAEIPNSVKNLRTDYNYDSYRHELIEKLKDAHDRSRAMIQQRNVENKDRYDKKIHKKLELKRHDLVMKKIENKKHKFDEVYSGPFRVEKPITEAVTQIKVGKRSVIVHNDKLKLAKADHRQS